MSYSRALVEAQRCLQCHEAPCTHACPAHVDVPGFIRRLSQENLEGSNQLLFERNPLATLCGLVCPTLELCEGACVLPRLGQSHVRIGALQYFVARQGQSALPIEENRSPKRVTVVGAGPSGLGCAVALRRLGHVVDVYDRATTPGGLISQVIPPYRLPHEVVVHDLEVIERSGIVWHLGVDVHGDMAKELVDESDAVFLGLGLARSENLSVPGSGASGIRSALQFLQQARSSAAADPKPPPLGQCVVIVGGGNVALDAAVTTKRMGVERVIVLYRRTLEEMPAWRSEYLEASSLGVEFRWLSTVQSIKATEGRVRAVVVQPMRRIHRREDGRRGVEPDPDSPSYVLNCDSLLMAVGQSLDPTLFNSLSVAISARGMVITDSVTFQTNQPKIYAAGEAVTGPSTVVESLTQGMTAGRAISRWLSSLTR